MTIWENAGVLALGSRIRHLSSYFAGDAEAIYKLYGVNADTKWFPVIYSLWKQGPMSITALARYCGHSHPSISKIVKEMQQEGLLKIRKADNDARVNVVDLSARGKSLLVNLADQCEDVEDAAEELLAEANHNLWEAIEEIEALLQRKSLLERVTEKFNDRCERLLQIVEFEERHTAEFQTLNYEWIKRYFSIEEEDRHQLENPMEEIIDKGGHILMAMYGGMAVGTCALVKMPGDEFELVKMCVAENFKGKGIGRKLGEKAVKLARRKGAKRIYLESNSKLVAAISLYRKLGFREIPFEKSPYSRCNIQMELTLAPEKQG